MIILRGAQPGTGPGYYLVQRRRYRQCRHAQGHPGPDRHGDGSLLNGGSMTAGERLSLLATDSIRNAMAGEIRASHVDLTSLTGDIVNERTAHAQYQGDGTLITPSRSRKPDQRGPATGFDAGRALTTERHQQRRRRERPPPAISTRSLSPTPSKCAPRKRRTVTEQSRTEHLAPRQRRRQPEPASGGDITLLASQANAGKDLSVAAGGTSTQLAAANETDHEVHSKRNGAKTHEQTTQMRRNRQPRNAAGNLTATAGQDILLHASPVYQRQGCLAYLIAGGQLEVMLTPMTATIACTTTRKRGSFGAIKTQRDEVTDVTRCRQPDQHRRQPQPRHGGDPVLPRAHGWRVVRISPLPAVVQ